ncbi:MAG: hypothetical protein J7621_08880 [Niastella sp.]|nr:hypothetical protein [Niastella sp.]
MNKYLLLRDNKQSGPYSVDELEKLGLKSYDLVWLDGKSAAWRYPSEIDELRHFAPAGEEQPYDRFYKKKTTQQATAAQQTPDNVTLQETTHTEATVVTTPVTANNIPQHITTKKIYVTLPAGTGNRNTNTVTATNNNKTEQAKTQTAEQEANAKMLNEKFARLREEKIKQAEEMAAKPAITNKAIASQPIATQTATPVVGFSEIVEQHHPQQKETLAPAHLRSRNNKLLMRSIVAACLVLGGIIIGLVISNSRQQQNNAALDEIVRKIQEREKRLQLAAQTVAIPIQTEITANDPGAVSQQEPPAENASSKQALIDKPVDVPAKKTTTPANKETQPAKNEQQQNIKIIPAVVTNKPEEKAVNHQEIEKTRRNIHQLVAVDANKYKTGVLGGISQLKLTLSNNSLYPLDEVEVEVRYLGPEKRVVKTQLLRFSDVAAGEQKTVEAPNTNRGVTVNYTITRINSKALGLAHAGY